VTTGARMRALFAQRQWLVVLALLLLVVSVVMPRVSQRRDIYSYIVTFDITQSMDTEDVALNDVPTSRLEFARAAMRETLGKLPCGSKIGWSVFTGQRTLLLLPPTEVCSNFDSLLSSLNAIDGRMRWTNWSRIAEGGIYSAVHTAESVGKDAAVIFVTDGQEAPPVLPSDDRVRDIASAKVRGWLIGVGGDQPASIPRTDANGNRIGYWRAQDVIQVPTVPGKPTTAESHEELSELRGQYLASVAQKIGFGYRRLVSPVSLTSAMLDKQLSHREAAATDLSWCPALLALLLLTWRFLPALGKKRRSVQTAVRQRAPAVSPVAQGHVERDETESTM
jgi:mxaL protein